MLTLLFLLLASYAAGVILPLCVPRMPQMQGVLGSVCGCVASFFGIALGIGGLIASEPLTASVASVIPFSPLRSGSTRSPPFFVLTISLAGLVASIYAMGYLKGYCQLKSNRADFYKVCGSPFESKEKPVSTEQSSEQHGVGTQLEDASQPALNEAEREELRALVSQAVEVIPPNWPLRTFAYRNPLIGFEHLPFDEAVSQAKKLLGGEGYLVHCGVPSLLRRGTDFREGAVERPAIAGAGTRIAGQCPCR